MPGRLELYGITDSAVVILQEAALIVRFQGEDCVGATCECPAWKGTLPLPTPDSQLLHAFCLWMPLTLCPVLDGGALVVKRAAQGHGRSTRSTAAVLHPGQLRRSAALRLQMLPQILVNPACEMETSQHVGAITELDLSICQQNTLVDRINAVPGLKTSAGEFLKFFFLSSFLKRPVSVSEIQCLPRLVEGVRGNQRQLPPSYRATSL
jgi:hypothetical protein